MPKQVLTTLSFGEHLMDLPIDISGLSISVGPGLVIFFDEKYDIRDAEFHTVGSYADTAVVLGYLVLDSTSNEVRLFVDEYLMDGVDTPFSFIRGSNLTPLATLFQFHVPPGTKSLLDIEDWQHWRIIPEVQDA